ncbi:MAG: hemolysin family protein [Clostridia bacterium]
MDEHSIIGSVVPLSTNSQSFDEQTVWFIVSLVILVALSAFFSATETAFSSINRARLKNMAQDGDKKAKLAYKLSEKYDELLSTILIGNNIVNIATATIATLLCVQFWQNNGATISTIITTVVVLIFGEITPKSIAKQIPESYAIAVSPVINMLMFILKPINFLLIKLKSCVTGLFDVQASSGLTEDELLTLVDEAEQGGELNEEKSELIKNAIEFNDVEAIDIFTPRTDVEAISIDDSVEKITEVFNSTGFSRLPVYKDTIDTVLGVINEKDFHKYILGKNKDISSILKPAEFIPPSMKISSLLKILQRRKVHFAVIVDEFGGTEGIVTMEDILEELVGEIWDEHDEVVDAIRDIGDGKFIVPTDNELDDMLEMFKVTEETEASTINGWVVDNIDKIPAVGDSFELDNLTVFVTKSESQRATEIQITVNFEKIIKEEDDD